MLKFRKCVRGAGVCSVRKTLGRAPPPRSGQGGSRYTQVPQYGLVLDLCTARFPAAGWEEYGVYRGTSRKRGGNDPNQRTCTSARPSPPQARTQGVRGTQLPARKLPVCRVDGFSPQSRPFGPTLGPADTYLLPHDLAQVKTPPRRQERAPEVALGPRTTF